MTPIEHTRSFLATRLARTGLLLFIASLTASCASQYVNQLSAELVEVLTASLDLEELQFADDHRVRFMGQALDHIYMRGLSALQADTSSIESSDHNPMSVTFSL